MSQSILPRPDRLIPGSRIAGTPVYDLRGERLGHIDDIMIDRPSGRVAYAVLAFGGFLGFGDTHHPLPWNQLRYDAERGGYVVDVDQAALQGAPAYAAGAAPEWDDHGWGKVDDHYGTRADDEMPLDASLTR